MKSAIEQAFEAESGFIAGVGANLKTTGGRFVAGKWFERQELDRAEDLRAAMIDRRIFDRQRFASMPHGRGFVVRGYERRWLFGKRVASVTIASTLVKPGSLLEAGGEAGPASLSDVTAHLGKLITADRAPQLIGICSPSGFSPEVHQSQLGGSKVIVVLVEPRPGGGWRVSSAGRKVDERLLKLFDPEDGAQKVARVKAEVAARSTDLLTGGLSGDSMARKLDVPPAIVEQAFLEVAKSEPGLRVSRSDGQVLLFRGAGTNEWKESDSMSLAEWIKSLFSREGEEAKKINVLAERRASLSSRLDRLYEEIGILEKREGQILEEGRQATSQVSKRRIAGQVARLRKDIARSNTSAALLSKQINIISTHIHNLELSQTGGLAQLPSGEELTEAAVAAEEILEQLSTSDELVSGLDVGMAEVAMSADEAAILKELEGPQESKADQRAPGAPEALPPQGNSNRQRGSAQAEG